MKSWSFLLLFILALPAFAGNEGGNGGGGVVINGQMVLFDLLGKKIAGFDGSENTDFGMGTNHEGVIPYFLTVAGRELTVLDFADSKKAIFPKILAKNPQIFGEKSGECDYCYTAETQTTVILLNRLFTMPIHRNQLRDDIFTGILAIDWVYSNRAPSILEVNDLPVYMDPEMFLLAKRNISRVEVYKYAMEGFHFAKDHQGDTSGSGVIKPLPEHHKAGLITHEVLSFLNDPKTHYAPDINASIWTEYKDQPMVLK